MFRKVGKDQNYTKDDSDDDDNNEDDDDDDDDDGRCGYAGRL